MYTKSSISITKPSASNCADFIGFPIGPTPCSRQRPRKHEMNRHSPKKYDEAKSKNKMVVHTLVSLIVIKIFDDGESEIVVRQRGRRRSL